MESKSLNWESQYAYLTKKFHELSLDALLEASGDSMIRLKAPILREHMKGDDQLQLETEQRQRLQRRIQEIYSLLRDREFFTDRQRQVMSLLFGWNGTTYVGPKSVSDIAKLLSIAQPVAFNHLRLAVKKLKKHFGIIKKGRKSGRSKTT